MQDTTHEPETDIGQRVWPSISERAWIGFLSVICVVILFANLGSAEFFEPDEGRNAEKAREILVLNDWITPHHNFLPTLDKPMPYYWSIAIAFKLFGLSEAAARLPSVLAAFGCVFLLYRFARREWAMGEALWSSLILVTSIGFFVFARTVIFDMTLTFFVTLALISFYTAAHAPEPSRQRLHSTIMYGALSAGTLIKGAIGLVIPGMIIFFYLALTSQWIVLRRMGIGRGAILYCAIVLPWYLWAEARNNGFLRYFLWEEHFGRYLTSEFERRQTWYYFIVVAAVGFFPWSMLLPSACRELWIEKHRDLSRFLALWALLPVIFFSFSSSQLPQYLLPILPSLALITGRLFGARWRTGGGFNIVLIPWLLIIAVVAYLLAGAAWPSILARYVRSTAAQNVWSIILCGGFLVMTLGIFLRHRRGGRWRSWSAVYVSSATGLALFFVLLGELTAEVATQRGAKSLAQAAAPYILPEDRVAFYDTYLTAMAFYLDSDKPLWIVQREGRDSIMGSNYLGAHRPEAPAGYGQVVYSFSDFARQWKRPDLILRVIVKEKNLQRLIHDVGVTPQILARAGEYLLVTNR